jgi:formylglycine-generating enzyme required for sulfatase activity
MSDMSKSTTTGSPPPARPGPGIHFSSVKVARVGAAIDVTFDVAWEGSWGPGARGAGFCDRNWDAAWVFLKLRPASAPGLPAKLRIEPPRPEVLDDLVAILDAGDARQVRAGFNGLREAGSPAPGPEGADPWANAAFVVRTVRPGSAWTLDVRDTHRAPSYRIEIERRREAGRDGLAIGTVRRWKHAKIVSVEDQPEHALVELAEGGAGVFLHHRSPSFRGRAEYRGVRLRCVMMDLPMDVQPRVPVEVWPFGLEMVHVPEGPFWLGDPEPTRRDAPRNCFYDALAPAGSKNRAYQVRSAAGIHVGPGGGATRPEGAEQLLWYDNDDDARGAGDHARIHTLDALSPSEKWKEGKIPRGFPTGYQAFYAMKRQVTQGEYASFINALDGGSSADRFGQLVRYAWGGAGSQRGSIEAASTARVATRPHRACNHLCWADATAFAAWAGLRPMSELEYEKACRGPLAPVRDEFAWGQGPGDYIAHEILGHEDGTEQVLGTCNIGNGSAPFLGGDGGVGPVRDDAFERRRKPPSPETFWLNPTGTPPVPGDPGGERENRGLSYYGIAGLTGNLWELCVTIGTREGRAFRGDHGRGEVSDHGEASHEDLGWPDQTARSVSWRGGSWYTPWRRGFVAARPYGSGAPGFFHRSKDAGFRAVRTAPVALPAGRSEDELAQQEERRVRFRNPDKYLTWLLPERARVRVRGDDAVSAALLDMSVTNYRATRESVDVHVGSAARALMADASLRAALAALRFRPRGRLVGLGDDVLDDRQSWLDILRHVVDGHRTEARLGVHNTSAREETTAQMIPRVARMVRVGFGDKPVDVIFCLAGVSDARRVPGLDRTVVSPAETEANLGALRLLCAPLLERARASGPGPAPLWVWLTPPRCAPPEPGLPPAGSLADADLERVAAAVRAEAARHPEDVLVDLQREAVRLHVLPVESACHDADDIVFNGDAAVVLLEGQMDIARAVLRALRGRR